MIGRTTRFLLGSLLWLACAPPAAVLFAREGAAPPLTEQRARWEQLTPEERKLVLDRFEEWRRLPEEEKQDLADRHRALGEVKDRVLTDLPAPEKDRIRRLRPRERNRALGPHLSRFLQCERQRVLELAGLPAPGCDKVPFSRIRKSARAYAGAMLGQLEEEGHLQEGEAEKLLSLTPCQMKRALREIQRRHILQHPPRALLTLPDEERQRLLNLDPDAFVREIERLKGEAQGSGIAPMMKDLLHGRHEPPPRPLPEKVLRRVLDEEQFQRFQDAPPQERRKLVLQFLEERARARLSERGEDANILEPLQNAPDCEKERRLLEIIEGGPALGPPPGPRGPRPPRRGNGQGPPRDT
ncbi:MAG: hypothetical protein HY812_12110 [Planctomycetes bacterium]|nr:hypothetical protein [Planctomycetota bacterium]